MQADFRHSRQLQLVGIVFIVSTGFAVGQAQRPPTSPYYPDRFDWQQRRPEQVGMDAAKLDAAIRFAVANENPATKDLAVDLATTFGREPFDTPTGPVKARGALNGVVLRHGYLVAEWGESTRVDMTFSVTKTFLSTVVGLTSRTPISSTVRTTNQLHGITCCGRRAIGRERSGASLTGPIGRKGRRLRSGRTASCTIPARITSTTTCA
jgi:hypothetical protein